MHQTDGKEAGFCVAIKTKKKKREKKIVMLATNRWHCRISNIGYYKETNDIKKGQLQQVMVVDAYMLRNAVHTSEIPFS